MAPIQIHQVLGDTIGEFVGSYCTIMADYILGLNVVDDLAKEALEMLDHRLEKMC